MSIEENRKLIEEIPFLLPRNRWTGEVSPDYDYSYTELDIAEFPRSWKRYLLPLAREIKAELDKIGYSDEYYILQIKEKYNSLRWYANGTTEEIEKIVSKCSDLCRKTCARCGKPAKWITRYGWIESFCDDCFRKEFDVEPEDVCYDLEKEDEDKPSDTLVVEDNKNDTTNEVVTSGETVAIEEDSTLSNETETTDDSTLVSESTNDTKIEENAPVLESVALYVNGASAPSGTWILTVGKDYTTYFDKTPADMTVENVTYRSTGENISKVDANGKISALAVGTATVYMNADGVEDYVSLKVNEVQQSSVASTTGGSGTGTTGSTSADVRAYVLNSSNHKFHKPSCSKLPTKNRVDVESTRDDLIAQGYVPCKICNP